MPSQIKYKKNGSVHSVGVTSVDGQVGDAHVAVVSTTEPTYGTLWIDPSSTGNTIDTTPTANSTNLVTSGGVKSYVDAEDTALHTADGRLGNAIGMRGWNQLVSASTTSVTLTSGEKYFTKISGTESITTGSGASVSVTGGTDMVINLSTLFGSGNEPTTVAEFRTLFNASYYPYHNGNVDKLNFVSRPNLLDNWYFGNPVNQRGQSSYTNSAYTIDRWWHNTSKTLTVSSNYISLVADEYFAQYIENGNALLGRNVTASIIIDGVLYEGTAIIPQSYPFDVTLISDTISGNKINIQFTWDSGASYPKLVSYVRTSINILAVKLELGTEQTLAHQEGGAWVLNEIPDFGEQLAKCQRYQYQFNENGVNQRFIGCGVARSTSNCDIMISLPTSLSNGNANVSVEIEGDWALFDGTNVIGISSMSVNMVGGSHFLLTCNTYTSATVCKTYELFSAGNNPKLLVSKNL